MSFQEKVEEKPKEEVIKTDTSKLSKRQKREIFDKTSPEFMVLLDDTKGKNFAYIYLIKLSKCVFYLFMIILNNFILI